MAAEEKQVNRRGNLKMRNVTRVGALGSVDALSLRLCHPELSSVSAKDLCLDQKQILFTRHSFQAGVLRSSE